MTLLTLREAAKALKVQEDEVKQYVKDGIPHLKIGYEYRFFKEEILSWQKEHIPSQEQLESEFTDEKGRTIKDYVLIDQVAEFLQMKKEKIYRLCKSGMPFQLVGKKRFFNLEDIITYFHSGSVEKKPAARKKAKKIDTPVSVIETKPQEVETKQTETKVSVKKKHTFLLTLGTNKFGTTMCGAGIVVKDELGTTGFAYKFNEVSMIEAESTAIFYALKLIKEHKYENPVIGASPSCLKRIRTDGLYKSPEFNALYNEMKDQVKFISYKNAAQKRFQLYKKSLHKLYSNAEFLSRLFKFAEVKDFDLSKNLLGHNEENIRYVAPKKSSNPVEKALSEVAASVECDNELVVQYVRTGKKRSTFSLTFNGKTEETSFLSTNATKAALSLVQNFISRSEEKNESLKVRIGDIPSFDKDIVTIMNGKEKNLNSFKELLNFAVEHSIFHSANDFNQYMIVNKKVACIA